MFNYYGVKTTGNKLWLNSTITSKEDIDKEPTVISLGYGLLNNLDNNRYFSCLYAFKDVKTERIWILAKYFTFTKLTNIAPF